MAVRLVLVRECDLWIVRSGIQDHSLVEVHFVTGDGTARGEAHDAHKAILAAKGDAVGRKGRVLSGGATEGKVTGELLHDVLLA